MPHNYIQTKTCLIASGATDPTAAQVLNIEAYDIMGLTIPTLTSCDLSIQVSNDGTTFFDLYDGSGTQVLKWTTTTGNKALSSRDLAAVIGFRYIRPHSSGAQGADRTFTLTLKDANN